MRFPGTCVFMLQLYKVHCLLKLVLVSDPELAQIPHIYINLPVRSSVCVCFLTGREEVVDGPSDVQ